MGAELKVKISGDGSGFAAALDAAKKQAASFSGDLSGKLLSGFALSALSFLPGLQSKIASLFDPSNILAKLDELKTRAKEVKLGSLRTGQDVETYQRQSNALESSGLSAESAAGYMSKLAKAQEEAKNGSIDSTKNTVKLAESLASLGVTLTDLQTKTPQQLFATIAENLKEVSAAGKLTGEQMAALREVFGKGAVELTPFFAKGTAGQIADIGNLTEQEISKFGEMGARLKTAMAVVNDAYGGGLILRIRRLVKGDESEPETDPGDAAAQRNAAKVLAAKQAKAKKEADALAEKSVGKEADKVEKDVEEQRRKNLAAVSTPEEKRLEIVKEIAKHEKEIAEIRAYQEAGAFTVEDARLRIGKENLAIEKLLGEQAAVEKEKGAKEEVDKWTKLGARGGGALIQATATGDRLAKIQALDRQAAGYTFTPEQKAVIEKNKARATQDEASFGIAPVQIPPGSGTQQEGAPPPGGYSVTGNADSSITTASVPVAPDNSGIEQGQQDQLTVMRDLLAATNDARREIASLRQTLAG